MARRLVQDGAERRWVEGEGAGAPSDVGRRLLIGCAAHRSRWDRLGRAAGAGVDQVTAEAEVWSLVDRGLARVHERRMRNGDWSPYQWELTEAGLGFLPVTVSPDVATYLTREDPPEDPVLGAIRAWLTASVGTALERALVMAVGEELRAGRTPRGRLLSVAVGGHSKAVRVTDHRATLEAAFGGVELEEVVRLTGRAVLAFGDFRFRVGQHALDGRWSVPWLALTAETLRDMEALEVSARRLLTIENLVAFEEASREGVPSDTILVYTGGFVGALERQFLCAVVEAGVRHVEHWGDLDVGGLRILRHLGAILPVPVRPFRMEPELLDRLPTRPLTSRDVEALTAWVADAAAPARDLAAAMLSRGVKAEQEGWFLG